MITFLGRPRKNSIISGPIMFSTFDGTTLISPFEWALPSIHNTIATVVQPCIVWDINLLRTQGHVHSATNPYYINLMSKCEKVFFFCHWQECSFNFFVGLMCPYKKVLQQITNFSYSNLDIINGGVHGGIIQSWNKRRADYWWESNRAAHGNYGRAHLISNHDSSRTLTYAQRAHAHDGKHGATHGIIMAYLMVEDIERQVNNGNHDGVHLTMESQWAYPNNN